MATKRTFIAKNLNNAVTAIGVGVAVSSTEPTTVIDGSLWYSSQDNLLYLRSSSAWLKVGGSNSVLPSQTGNAGKILTTDGTTATWSTAIPSVGADTQIVYNSGGILTTSPNLAFDGTNIIAAGHLYSASSNAFAVLNDISTQFDGVRAHFALKLDQNTINNIVDSKDLEVVVGGLRLTPYVTTYTWPWLSPVDSFNGFRVRTFNSANYITIYNAPARGDNSSIVLKLASATTQKRRYPFSATTIALGD
jgi:hypothetical protein